MIRPQRLSSMGVPNRWMHIKALFKFRSRKRRHVSADIASDNANRYGHPAAMEVKILALHGILHLAGFDHESDNGKMARKEAALRRTLGLPSSLTERGALNEQPRSRPRSRSKGTRRMA